MKIEITPAEKIEVLMENLETRVENSRIEDGKIIAEIEDPETLEKIPGIEEFTAGKETREGLKGSPVDEQAYAKLESRKDAVKALVATIMGYDLRILDTGREWDYRNLKKYNPDIKHLRFDEPREEFRIDKATFETPGCEMIEIDLEDRDVEAIYRTMLT